MWRALASCLRRWVEPTGGLLDLGAGRGEFSRSIRAGRKWALDTSRAPAECWGPDIRPLIQSALDPLPIPSNRLSTVFASNLLDDRPGNARLADSYHICHHPLPAPFGRRSPRIGRARPAFGPLLAKG